MIKKRIIVLGGGMSGLGVAWRAAEYGAPVQVIEAKPEIGGLAATIKSGPYRLDYGPHFLLSERPDLIKKITDLFSQELPAFKRSAQLFFHGRFFNYPLTARNVLFQMPLSDAFFIASSYFTRLFWDSLKKVFAGSVKDPTFEQWARSSFGDYLFRLFFKPYTEQFWQIPCPQLSPDSMPTNTRLSFFKTLKLLFVKDVVKASMSLVERETTLLLRYPRQGIGEVAEKIADRIKRAGGEIELGWEVREVRKKPGGGFSILASDGKSDRSFDADIVVSTIPLTNLIPAIRPLPPPAVRESVKRLEYLSLIVVYLVVPRREILNSSYLYQLATPYNRMGDMNKFCPDLSPPEENMLALEFTCHKGDSLWKASKEELFETSVSYLERDGILKKDEVRNIFILRAANGYPIYRHDYKPHLQTIRDFVAGTDGLEIVGRSGNYMYMDMDQCLGKGFELADRILKKASLD